MERNFYSLIVPGRHAASHCSGHSSIHQESRENYGNPNIWDVLINQGHCVSEPLVAQFMRVEGVRAKTAKKRCSTTHPAC